LLFRRILASCAAALLLAACTKVTTVTAQSAATGEARHPWTQAGVLRIGIMLTPNQLNPILTENTTESMLAALTFDLLVEADEKGNPVPRLATEVPSLENGGISQDGLTITYHLRQDVKWHDGVPFTSADVKYSQEQLMNPKNNIISRTGYELVRSVDTPDPATVVFHLKEKFVPFVNTVFAESDNPFRIIPKHLLAKYSDLNQVSFNSAPVGTGPFKFVSWRRGDRIEYEANDAYFMGKPHLRRIVARIIPDENTLVTALRTHEIDWLFEATPNTYKELKTMTDVKNILVDNNQYYGMIYNLKQPLLADVRVRKAIAYALDKTALVNNNTFGSASVATEDLPSYMWAYEPDVTRYERDPEKAKALLAEAGWKAGADGILTKGGKRLSLVMTYNQGSATSKGVSVQIQAALHAIGVEVEPKAYLGSLLFASYGAGGILQTGKFDLDLSGWIAGVDPDDSSQYLCKFIPPAGNNYTRECSKEMDAAQNEALGTFDQAKRKAAYSKIQKILADDMPQNFFWWPRQIQSINPDFKGFSPNPVTESWNAYLWDI
jgi:peptide/nickel transport system substrate-binding protein